MFIQVREALLWFSGSQLCYRLKSPETLFNKSTPDQLNQHFWGQNPGISIFSVMGDSSMQLKLRNYGQLQPKSNFSPFPLSLFLPLSSFPFSVSPACSSTAARFCFPFHIYMLILSSTYVQILNSNLIVDNTLTWQRISLYSKLINPLPLPRWVPTPVITLIQPHQHPLPIWHPLHSNLLKGSVYIFTSSRWTFLVTKANNKNFIWKKNCPEHITKKTRG